MQLGDRSGALAAYRTFARRLADELDAEPTPETQAAFDAIARDNAPLDDDPLPASASKPSSAPATLPFVGRDAEFGLLTRVWASAAQGAVSMAYCSPAKPASANRG